MSKRPAPGQGARHRPLKKPRREIALEEAKAELTLEQKFEAFCNQHPDGAPDKLVMKEFKSYPVHELTGVINNLLGQHLLGLFQSSAGLVYKMNTREEAQKMANLSQTDLNIYQLIRAAGNIGVWSKHLRTRSRLQQTQLTKILKTLEQRKLVKAEKSAENNRKVYMLYDLEPAKEVTGGIWYDGHTFDYELFNVLYDTARKWIASKQSASAVDVSTFFRQSGLVAVTFTTQDIASVLHSLCLDGHIEPLSRQNDNSDFVNAHNRAKPSISRIYRTSNTGVARTDMARIPCSSCPVANVCNETSTINPSSCEYLSTWMTF